MSTNVQPDAGTTPAGPAKLVICPYCGDAQPTAERCRSCRGAFEPLSRQATHNAMGPWFVHDKDHPFRPGCSYETLAVMIERGQVTKYTIIRGPTSKQFWTVARHVPGVSHLLGYCHECDAKVETTATGCSECGALFGAYLDRNHLGLPEVRPLPGEAPDVEGEAVRAGMSAPAAPVWRSVSSFGADEELLARGPGPGAAPTPATGATSRATVTANGGGPSGDPLQSPVVRAMRQRIARQQRTIRLLVTLVFFVAVAGAAVNLATAIRQRAAVPEAGAPAPSAASDDGAGMGVDAMTAGERGTGVEESSAGQKAPDEDTRLDGSVERASGDPAGSEPSGGDAILSEEVDALVPPTPSDGGAADVAAERQRAQALARDAADGTRVIAERVADYEAALAILRRLSDSAADPATLEAEIARLEDRVERLRLTEFFR